jgi:hypothetical protein
MNTKLLALFSLSMIYAGKYSFLNSFLIAMELQYN